MKINETISSSRFPRRVRFNTVRKGKKNERKKEKKKDDARSFTET